MTLLNKTECSALRGIAIMGIFMHNFLHWLSPMVKENEYLFNRSNVDRLNSLLLNPSADLLWQLFSFFGHYGVPLFLFLSGYGLVLKYEQGSHALPQGGAGGCETLGFLRHHFMKLFPMMLLGFVAFVLVDWITPHHHYWAWVHVVGLLTMTVNFFSNPDQVIWPGPYWFFGLIMQLYLIYILVLHRYRHPGVAVVLLLLCWLPQALCADHPVGDTLNRLRYNSIGGMLPFLMGVLLARVAAVPVLLKRSVQCVLLLLSLVAVVLLSQWFQAWLWVPAFVVVLGVAVVKLLPRVLLRPLDWMGALSAAVFVCHPITRKILIPISRSMSVEDGLLLYVVSTIVLAMLFQKIINSLKTSE